MLVDNVYKECFSRTLYELYKTLIAFANTEGGTVFLDEADQCYIEKLTAGNEDNCSQLLNDISGAIAPDLTAFAQCVQQEDGVIRIDVGEGNSKPYYLKSEGMRPSGVFVRQGTAIVRASQEEIQRFISESDGDVFEEMRSPTQDLTFEGLREIGNRHNIAFSEEDEYSFGFRNKRDRQYTNLAMILSDQCQFNTKVALFEDYDNLKLKEITEFSGSIIKQVEDVFSHIKSCVQFRTRTMEAVEVGVCYYSGEAIWEALVNAFMHRDYGQNTSTIVNINSSYIEIISAGALYKRMSQEELFSGISYPRNRKLTEIFRIFKFSKSCGTGLRRISALYKKFTESREPEVEITKSIFKMKLPNLGELCSMDKEVIAFLLEHGKVNDAEMAKLFDTKSKGMSTHTRKMLRRGLIECIVYSPRGGSEYILSTYTD